jgi:hypothetical protein
VKRNVWALVISGSLFGLAFGIYDLAFPLFLDATGVSLESIGLVLAAAALVNFFLMVYGGRVSDVFGRTGVYGGTLAVCAAANAVTPWAPHVAAQAVLKTLYTAGTTIRGSLRGVLIYESVGAGRFGNLFGRLVGLEVIFQTVGFACVGMVGVGGGATLSYRGVFALSAAAFAVGAAVFFAFFRDRPAAERERAGLLSLRSVFALDLHPKLYFIVVSGFIFSIGLTASHAMWVLYFRRQLDAQWPEYAAGFGDWLARVWPWAASVWTSGDRGPLYALVSLLAIIHRAALGIPMFLVAPLIRRRVKFWYVACLALSGVMTAAVALADWLAGSFLLVAILWPLHDLAGASIWYPMQERIVQHYSRPEQRGTQVAKVRALMAVGAIVGTGMAGALMAASPALPFFVGGVLILLSSLILLPL